MVADEVLPNYEPRINKKGTLDGWKLLELTITLSLVLLIPRENLIRNPCIKTFNLWFVCPLFDPLSSGVEC